MHNLYDTHGKKFELQLTERLRGIKIKKKKSYKANRRSRKIYLF